MPKPGSSVSQTTTSLLAGANDSTTDFVSFCRIRRRPPGKRQVSRGKRTDAGWIVQQRPPPMQDIPAGQGASELQCAMSYHSENTPVRLLISGFRVRVPERPVISTT